jgi:hypothetical protein
VVKLLLNDPQPGDIEQEVASRFEVLPARSGAFMRSMGSESREWMKRAWTELEAMTVDESRIPQHKHEEA